MVDCHAAYIVYIFALCYLLVDCIANNLHVDFIYSINEMTGELEEQLARGSMLGRINRQKS